MEQAEAGDSNEVCVSSDCHLSFPDHRALCPLPGSHLRLSVLTEGHQIVEGASEDTFNRTAFCRQHCRTTGITPGVEDLSINFPSEAKWLKFLKNILHGLWKKRTNPRTRGFWEGINCCAEIGVCVVILQQQEDGTELWCEGFCLLRV